MKKILISVICVALFASFSFAQEALSVYKKTRGQIDEDTPVGSLLFTDYIKELPIPMDSVKKVTVVKEKVVIKDKKGNVKKDKKGNPKTKMQRKRVVTWEKVEPSEPPRFVPIQCKLGEVWVKRADLARFKQASRRVCLRYRKCRPEKVSDQSALFLFHHPERSVWRSRRTRGEQCGAA